VNAATTDKPQRDYVRVPSEMSQEINLLAARYDVPVRSVTRLLLCIGMDVLHCDEASARTVMSTLLHKYAEDSASLVAPTA
jgi:hypothetical protein